MSKREPEPELMLAYQRAVSSIEKYQKALSKYVAKLESGGVDALILDSERTDLLLLYRDADIKCVWVLERKLSAQGYVRKSYRA